MNSYVYVIVHQCILYLISCICTNNNNNNNNNHNLAGLTLLLVNKLFWTMFLSSNFKVFDLL